MSDASAVRAGRAYVELLLENKAFQQGLAASMDLLRGFGRGMSLVGSIMLKAGTAILTPIAGAVVQFVRASSALDDMSQRTRIAASKLAELGYAAELTGSNLDDVEKAIRKMLQQINALRGGEKAARSLFRELNLGAEDFAGKSPDEQFSIIAKRLNEVHDSAKRVSLAQDIFGKSGAGILPMIANLEKLRAEARKEGLIPSDEAVAAGDEIGDAMDRIKKTIRATTFELGSAFAPAVLEVLQGVREFVRAGKNWVTQNHAVLQSVGRIGVWLVLAGGAFLGAGKGIIFLGNALLHTGRMAGLAGRLLGVPLRVLGSLRGVLGPFTKAFEALNKIGAAGLDRLAKTASKLGENLMSAARTGGAAIANLTGRILRGGSQVARAAGRMGVSLGHAFLAGVSQAQQAVSSLRPIVARIPGWLRTAFNTGLTAAIGFSQGLRYALVPAVGGVKDAANTLGYTLRYTFTRPLAYINALAPQLRTSLVRAFSVVQGASARVTNSLMTRWRQASSYVVGRVQGAAASIVSRFASASQAAGSRFSAGLAQASATITSKLAPIWQSVTGFAARAASRVKAVWSPVGSIVSAGLARIAPLLRQDAAKLQRAASTAAHGIVAAFRFAGPTIANGLTTAVRSGLSRMASMARATAAGMRRTLAAGASGVGRGLGGVVSGIGALAGLAGPMLGKFGELLAMAPLVISAVASIGGGLLSLVSPFGLVAAAIVGGIYAWTQFSDAGRESLASVVQFVQPILKTFQDTFAGIKEAIAGGDLALAGKIAFAGLKLALLQGVSGLAKALGGTWGDVVGKLGGQLAGGDFAGAWETAIAGMAAVWDEFAEGIVAVFTGAARAITDVWQATTTAISDFILQDAANGGIIGTTALAGTGVDMQKEGERAKAIRSGELQATRKLIEQSKADLAAAESNGGVINNETTGGQDVTSDQIKQQIADWEARLKELGATPANFLGDTQATAAADLGSSADSVRDYLAERDRKAQEKTRESKNRAAEASNGGAGDLDLAEQGAQSDLDRLVQEAKDKAAAARAQAESDKETAFDGIETDETQNKQEVFGSFSAAALAAQGGGGDKSMNKIASNTQSARDALYELINYNKKLVALAENGGRLR